MASNVQGKGNMKLDLETGKAIARAYEAAPNVPSDPSVREAYGAFNLEVGAQYEDLVRSGFTFEPWQGSGQPYADSRAMIADVRLNRHLWYFRSTEGTAPHALMTHAENERFRCVHDVIGHAGPGASFGPQGEYQAFLAHRATLSETAGRALLTETLGQNAWFNYAPCNAGRPVAERSFAPQKAVILWEVLRWLA